MVPQLVTQLDSDAPLVVVVGSSGLLRTEITRGVRALGLQVKAFSEAESTRFTEHLIQAYKVVWIVSSLSYFSDDSNSVKAVLQAVSKKVVLVVPLAIGIEPTRSTQELSEWQQLSSLQETIILDLNSQFTDSLFIFAENIAFDGVFPLEYCVSKIETGVVIDPGFSFSVQTISAFVTTALPHFFRPGSQQSILISGSLLDSEFYLEEFVRLYFAYFAEQVSIQREYLTPKTAIPFEVNQVVLETQNAQSIVDEYVRTFKNKRSSLKKVAVSQPLARPMFQKQAQVVETKPASVQIEIEYETVQNQMPKEESTASLVETRAVVAEKPVIETPKSKEDEELLDINQELSRIFKAPRTVQKAARVEKMAQTEVHHVGKSKRKKILFYGGLGFIGVGFGFLVLIGLFLGTQFFLKRQLFAIAKTAVQTHTVEEKEWNNLRQTAGFLDVQSKTYGAVFDLAMISDADHLVEVTSQLADMSLLLQSTEKDLQDVVYLILGKQDGELEVLTKRMTSQAETTYENLSLVRAGIEVIPFSVASNEKETILLEYQKKIDEIRTALITQRRVLPLLQDIFGGAKKSYLILFQNEQELRPTGGFIQAAALLTFSDGTLISSQVFSSYDIDSMVAGSVAPPEDLPRFLGEQQWYFRDSNWNPDFTSSASKAAWFMTKATGTKIDGVVGMTLKSTADLVEALGPLEIPEHSEIVTHKNIDALMEYHSEKLLIKGDTSKAYSVLILERLVEKIETIKPEKINGFLAAIGKNLDENELLISVTDDTTEEALTTLGWTGVLVRPECPSQFSSQVCLVDTIAQVEANVGVNKANYYLEEAVAHVVELLPGLAQHTRTIRVENTAEINSWPKGDYRAYYRFYVNANAKLDEVTINNRKLTKEDLVERVEQGKSMIGFLVTVPVQAQAEIVLKYSVPLVGDEAYSYAFFDQKQPGRQTSTQVTIIPYSGLKPAKIAPQAEVTAAGIVFDTETRKSHGFYGVEFR